MLRALATAGLVAATASTASAGVYGSVGIGNTGLDTSGTPYTAIANARSGRAAIGYQFTPYLSAEGGYIGFGAKLNSAQYNAAEYYAAGLVHYPLGQGFEVFGRLGAQKTQLSTAAASRSGLDSTGYLYGAGFEYVLRIPALAHAGVWVDYTRNNGGYTNELRPTAAKVDLGTSMWTLGVTVGF